MTRQRVQCAACLPSLIHSSAVPRDRGFNKRSALARCRSGPRGPRGADGRAQTRRFRVERRPLEIEELSGVSERPMIIPHASPSAALRPPASGSRPTQQRRDHRYGSRGPSFDGPWVARQGPEGRGEPGRDGPEGIGTSARSPGAPATREAHGPTSAGPCPASKLGIHVDARASARWTRQDQDSARRGSGSSVCAVAGAPAVPAIVAESVPCLATAAARVCA